MKKRRRVLKYRRNSKPRPPKTFADVSTLTGTEYYQTDEGVTLRLEDRNYDRMTTMQEVLDKFYLLNGDQQPLVFRLVDEPSGLVRGDKVYHIMFRGSFVVQIEQGHDKSGPHRCRLYFRSFTENKAHWIATLQLMAFFFNEAQVKETLLTEIANKTFYMLPANRERPITI